MSLSKYLISRMVCASNILQSDAADHARDRDARRIEPRRQRKERFEIRLLLQPSAQLARIIAGQPGNDLIHLFSRTSLFLRFRWLWREVPAACRCGRPPLGRRRARLVSLAMADRARLQEAGRAEKGGRSWTYAHLILAILTDECSQDLLDSSPGRPARGALRAVDMARAKVRYRDIARRDPRSPHARRFPEIPPPPRRTPKKTKIAVQIPRQPLILAPMGL